MAGKWRIVPLDARVSLAWFFNLGLVVVQVA